MHLLSENKNVGVLRSVRAEFDFTTITKSLKEMLTL